MIQRIQTVYLFLTTLLSLLFLKGSILTFSDESDSLIKITFRGILRASDGQGYQLIEKLLPLSVIIIIIPVLCLAAIMFFKNRKIQKLLVLILIVMVAGLIVVSGFYSLTIITTYSSVVTPGIKMLIPVIMLILSFLAYRGITKDDNLIKSYDRLR
jgi:hypothetical protein